MMKKLCLLFALSLLFFPLFAAEAEINLSQKAQEAGVNVYWDPFTQACVLEKDGKQVSFQSGGNYIIEDYTTIVQKAAPVIKNGELVTTASFFTELQHFFNNTEETGTGEAEQPSLTQAAEDSFEQSYRIGAIVIDPGHGGKDPGASATHTVKGKKVTVVEKDVNLKIGLALYERLKKAYPQKKIKLTRDKDVFISLEDRAKFANTIKLEEDEAILYVSIHVNASLDKSANGYEVWYLSPGYRRRVIDPSASEDTTILSILNGMMEEEFTVESRLMATFIQNGIKAQVGELSVDRSIKEEEWFVVKNVNMPSVLIETGFLTNEKEALLLADQSYLQKLTLGIYNGLQAFIAHFEDTRGFTGTR